jgi:flagellar FliJ protein
MAFVFRLESIRKYRKSLQDVAQREYAEAEANVRRQKDMIKSFYNRIDEARKERSIQQGSKSFSAEAFAGVEDFIKLTSIRITRAREEARELMQVMEEKHHNLVEKAKDRKILDKLKEKKYEQYKAEMKKLENLEMDDLVVMRHQNRGVSNE